MANPRESHDHETVANRNCRIMNYCYMGLLLVWWVLFGCEFFIGRYSSPKFQISSFSVSTFIKTSRPSSLLSSNWKITFHVQNPTHWDQTSYDQLEVSVVYRGISISSASLSPFQLHKEDEGLVGAIMATLDPAYDNVVSNIYDDFKNGAVNFTVAVNGTIRWMKSAFWRGYWHDMAVSCDNVMVGFYGGKTALVGGSVECKAHVKIGSGEFP